MSVAEVLERGGQVVFRVECAVCAPGERTLTRDCGNCDATGLVDELVPAMDFVRFVLELVPERESLASTMTLDGQLDELRKTLRDAIDRGNRVRATELDRQEAVRTASEAAQAILLLRQAAT